MRHYRLLVRVSRHQNIYTIVQAQNDIAAKQIGETMFGKGNVITFWQVR